MFKVGDKVKLNPNVKEFLYGRAEVSYEEIGKVKKVNGNELEIDFPSHSWFSALEEELIYANIIKNKNDLKVGDIVTLKNGDRLLVQTDEEFLDISDEHDNSICDFDDINDDLTYDGSRKDNDIIKVERPIEYETVYNRENTVREMTVDEISKALGYEVKIVKEEK